MKYSILFRPIILLLLPCLFIACERDKDAEEPAPIQNGYTSKEQATQAVDALYKVGLPALYLDVEPDKGLPLAWSAYLSGLIASEATEGYYLELNQGKINSPKVTELSQKLYTSCSSAILQADTVISRLPSTLGLDALEREQLLGEAKFFRAYNRFALLRDFGAHPLSPTNSGVQSEQSLYGLVVRDLQEAIARLPQKSFLENKRRIGTFVARALLAEVYLQMSGFPLQEDRWAEAVAILRPIIQSGKHQLALNGATEETSAYNELRRNISSSEYLYSISASSGISRGIFSFPRKAKAWSNMAVDVAFNAYQPSELLQSLYSEEDIRGKDRQFFHSFFKVQEGNKTVFEVFSPAPYFWLQGEGERVVNPSTPQIGLYRYAEVLLMLSEALLHTEGVSEEAVDCLLDVRLRAIPNLSRDVAKAELMVLSPEELLQEVWTERLRELILEMKVGYDITRTGLYPMKPQGSERIIFVPVSEARTPQGHTLPKQLRLPLPQNTTP